MIENRGPLRAFSAAVVTVVLWASAFVAIRHVGHDVPAGALTLGRLIVGGLVWAPSCSGGDRRHHGRGGVPGRGCWRTGYLETVCALMNWTVKHLDDIDRARERYDTRRAS
jgi:drug/metabolite transporter (DMT)-like permease